MTKAHPGEAWNAAPGRTPGEQAVAIAGFLSECGVQSVTARGGASERVLRARVTDLPAELLRLGAAEVLAGGGVEVRMAVEGEARTLLWRRDRPAVKTHETDTATNT